MTKTRLSTVATATLVAAVALVPSPGSVSAHDRRDKSFRANLRSFSEVPSVSSPAEGSFRGRLSQDGASLHYELSFSGLRGTITQAHIHFGERHTNGGIMVWLCSGPTNVDPTGLAPTCPQEGKVEGTLTAANIVQPGAAPPALGQGIAPGAFDAFVQALREGAGYANVHTSSFGGGEIRGQIR
jgi:hypothetical protein